MTIRDMIAAMRAQARLVGRGEGVSGLTWEKVASEYTKESLELRDRIAALEAENAALKAERDAYRSQFWDNALPELTEMRKQRDDARAAFNVMDGCYKQAVAERDSETRWAHHYFTAWQTARQSRARLVRLLKGRRKQWSREYHAYLGENDLLEVSNYELEQQRDAVRAWAAAWKRAAKWWRYYAFTYRISKSPDWWYASGSYDRRARRAAEAMERR